MATDFVGMVQQFADMINADPNLSQAEKEQQVQNYAASLGAIPPPPVQNPTEQQVIAADGSPIMGSNATYQQAVADQQQYNTSLAADAKLATYLQPGQSFTPLDVNYGGPPTITPDFTSPGGQSIPVSTSDVTPVGSDIVPPVDSIPVGTSDYLVQSPIQTEYQMVDFAQEQASIPALDNQSPVNITSTEYVPEWLAPFLTWVQTYNKPTSS